MCHHIRPYLLLFSDKNTLFLDNELPVIKFDLHSSCEAVLLIYQTNDQPSWNNSQFQGIIGANVKLIPDLISKLETSFEQVTVSTVAQVPDQFCHLVMEPLVLGYWKEVCKN
jgi:hypothetical protein